MPWVYILECADHAYYTGSTVDLEKRVEEHQQGTYSGYTSTRLPVKLVFAQETNTLDEAFKLEHQIKGWSRRKKEAIIAGNYHLLPALSQSYSKRKRDQQVQIEMNESKNESITDKPSKKSS